MLKRMRSISRSLNLHRTEVWRGWVKQKKYFRLKTQRTIKNKYNTGWQCSRTRGRDSRNGSPNMDYSKSVDATQGADTVYLEVEKILEDTLEKVITQIIII